MLWRPWEWLAGFKEMDADILLVLCTCPTRAAANAIATALLEERLAACVNQVTGIKSLYRWEGRVEDDDELMLLIKTTTAQYPALEEMIRTLHPYEVPEIIGIPLAIGSKAYFDWIRNSVR
jgi:periplasmic divalent cation tolerance protein